MRGVSNMPEPEDSEIRDRGPGEEVRWVHSSWAYRRAAVTSQGQAGGPPLALKEPDLEELGAL